MARRFGSTIENDFIPFVNLKGKDGYGYVHVYQKDKKYSSKIYIRFGTVIAIETSTYRANVLQRILDMPDLNERNANLISSRFKDDPENILIAEAALDQQMVSGQEVRKLIKENFIDSFYEVWTWDKVQLDWVANKEPAGVPTVPAVEPEKLLDIVRRASDKINNEIPQVLNIEPGHLINSRLQVGENRDYSNLRHIDQVLLSQAETGLTLNEIVYKTGQSKSVSQLAVVSMWLNQLLNLITEDGHVIKYVPETEEEIVEEQQEIQPEPVVEELQQRAEPNVQEPIQEVPVPEIQPFSTHQNVDYGVLDDEGEYESSYVPQVPEIIQEQHEETLEEESTIFDESEEESIGSIFEDGPEEVTETLEPEPVAIKQKVEFVDEEPVLKPQIDYFAEAFAFNFMDEFMETPEEEIPTSQEEHPEPEAEDVSSQLDEETPDEEEDISQEGSIFDESEDDPIDPEPEFEFTIVPANPDLIPESEAELLDDSEELDQIEDITPEEEEEEAPSSDEEEVTEVPENEELEIGTTEEMTSKAANSRIKDRLAAHLIMLKEETEEALAEANKSLEDYSTNVRSKQDELHAANETVEQIQAQLDAALKTREEAEKALVQTSDEHASLIEAKDIAQEDYDTVVQKLEEYQKGA